MTSTESLNRRDFLKLAAVGLTVITSAQLIQHQAMAAGPAEKGAHQWAMVIDQSKCTGCGYCTLACRAHNDVPPDISWNQVHEVEPVDGKRAFLARPCMHCEVAPCVDVCPVKANTYRPDGIVMMNYDRCIGCRYCELACPYLARSFNWKKFDQPNPAVPQWGQPEVKRRDRGVVEKCSFCYQRIDRGLALGLQPGKDQDASPACTVACPCGARIFGDLNDPESPVSKILRQKTTYRLREDLGTSPRVHYIAISKEV